MRRREPGITTIGHETIFSLQKEMAADVMAIVRANESPRTQNKRSPVAILPPQGGKSGVVAQVINDFIDDCVARQLTFQIVVFCGLPDLALIGQTRDRLTARMRADGLTPFGAQLHAKASLTGLCRYPGEYQREGILVLHNSAKLRRLDLNCEVDRRLFIGDEIHLGNVRDGNIDTFLKNHGVRLNEQIHTWGKGRTINHFVGVSATPAAHMLKSDNLPMYGEALFRWVYRLCLTRASCPEKTPLPQKEAGAW